MTTSTLPDAYKYYDEVRCLLSIDTTTCCKMIKPGDTRLQTHVIHVPLIIVEGVHF